MNLLKISIESLNLLSFMLGMFFAASMWRTRAMIFVAGYAFVLAGYFWFQTQYP